MFYLLRLRCGRSRIEEGSVFAVNESHCLQIQLRRIRVAFVSGRVLRTTLIMVFVGRGWRLVVEMLRNGMKFKYSCL